MSRRRAFIERQWRWTRRFFVFFPFWIALITGINIWDDARRGASFDPTHLLYAAGFLLFAGALFWVSRLIFRFVRGYVKHMEHAR